MVCSWQRYYILCITVCLMVSKAVVDGTDKETAVDDSSKMLDVSAMVDNKQLAEDQLQNDDEIGK